MKRDQFEIRPYSNPRRPRYKFCVHASLNGKRTRNFFETEKEAKTFRNLKRTELDECGTPPRSLFKWGTPART